MKRKVDTSFTTIEDLYNEIDLKVWCYYFDMYFVKKNQNNHWSPNQMSDVTKHHIIAGSCEIVYNQLKYYFKQPQYIDYHKWGISFDMTGSWRTPFHKRNTGALLRIEFTNTTPLDKKGKRKILKSIKPKLNKVYRGIGHRLLSKKYKTAVLYRINDKDKQPVLYL